MRPESQYMGSLPAADVQRINRIAQRLKASSNVETIRRISISFEELLNHQDDGGDIVLCKQGRADRVVWFL